MDGERLKSLREGEEVPKWDEVDLAFDKVDTSNHPDCFVVESGGTLLYAESAKKVQEIMSRNRAALVVFCGNWYACFMFVQERAKQ